MSFGANTASPRLRSLIHQAPSTDGVKSVDLSARVNGTAPALGAAIATAEGTSISARPVGPKVVIGNETGAAGSPATLPHIASGAPRHHSPGGSSFASAASEHGGGSRTLSSHQGDDIVPNGGTTFVFMPGYGQDTMTDFRLAGLGHDTIALPSSEFASFAQVLRDTQNTPSGALILDTASGDSLLLAGISKSKLALHKADFVFSA